MKSPDEHLYDAREYFKRTGGQAWPGVFETIQVETNYKMGRDKVTRAVPVRVRANGMTVLEYFAGQSITGIRASDMIIKSTDAAVMAFRDAAEMIRVARVHKS